jgi:glycosyltransferase involved in cell wall biosynthesis
MNRLLSDSFRFSVVYVAPRGAYANWLVEHGHKVVAVNLWKESGFWSGNWIASIIGNLYATLAIGWKTSRESVDVVLANGLGASLIAIVIGRIRRLPVMVVHHHPVFQQGSAKTYMISVILNLADGVVAVSNSAKYSLERIGVDRSKLTTIYNGIDYASHRKAALCKQQIRGRWGVKENEILVAIPAMIARWKGQHQIIEALKRVPMNGRRIKIALCGEPLDRSGFQYKMELQSLCGGISDQILFLGRITPIQLVLEAADYIALTSIEPEPLNTALCEAVIYGKPVAASREGGNVEICESYRNCTFVEPNSVDGWSEWLSSIKVSAVPGEFKADVAVVAERFDLNLARTRYREYIQKLVGEACEGDFAN